MSDRIKPNHAAGRRSLNALAMVALLAGICTGPISVVLVRSVRGAYGSRPTLSWAAIDTICIGTSGAVGFVLAAYCFGVYAASRARSNVLGRKLAFLGLFTSVAWSMAVIFLYWCFHLQHLARVR